ncbi:MAG: hypothetical protein GY842_24590 [bacterium]|nr:hypothetical protein [bacterium]
MVQRFPICICVVSVAYAIVVLLVAPDWTVDDAYIGFRYAANLAWHGQLTWNVGDDPIEGYTGVALPVMLASLMRLGASPIWASKAIGILSLFVGGVFLYRTLGRLAIREAIRSVMLLLYLAAPILFTHALSGLETMLFSSCVVAGLWAVVVWFQERERWRQRISVLCLILLLTSLVRPEGVVLAGVCLATVVGHEARRNPDRLRRLLIRCGLLYVLPAATYFAWRWWYYGLLLPNTFYAKSRAGWNYFGQQAQLSSFLLAYVMAGFLAAGVLLLLGTPRTGWRELCRRILPEYRGMALVSGVGLAFMAVVSGQYLRTDPVMNYAYRYYAPFLPVLLIIMGGLLHVGREAWTDACVGRPARRVVGVVLLTGLGLYQARAYRLEQSDQFVRTLRTARLLRDEHIPIGRYLKANLPATETLVVHLDAGAVPFYAELDTVDFGKLNDEYLATHDLTSAQCADYFYSLNAGALVIASSDRHTLKPSRGGEALIEDPRFERYSFLRDYCSPAFPNYRQLVFLRNDLYARVTGNPAPLRPHPGTTSPVSPSVAFSPPPGNSSATQ